MLHIKVENIIKNIDYDASQKKIMKLLICQNSQLERNRSFTD